jgi:hypothetical protein
MLACFMIVRCCGGARQRAARTRELARAFVPMESEKALLLYLTRFLYESRYPPRIKSGAGFRWKTL